MAKYCSNGSQFDSMLILVSFFSYTLDTPQSTPTKKAEGGVAYRGGQATPLGNSFDSGSTSGFTHVDLQQDSSSMSKNPSGPIAAFSDAMSSLRSSVSSLASDSSFMFPVLESSGPTYNFQVDFAINIQIEFKTDESSQETSSKLNIKMTYFHF